MPAAVTKTAVVARCEHFVRDLLLLGCQGSVEWFFDCKQFVQSRRRSGKTRLPAFKPLNGGRAMTFPALSPLFLPCLDVLVFVFRMLAYHCGEIVPLCSLCVGDFQRSLQVSKACFNLFTGKTENLFVV